MLILYPVYRPIILYFEIKETNEKSSLDYRTWHLFESTTTTVQALHLSVDIITHDQIVIFYNSPFSFFFSFHDIIQFFFVCF